MLLGSDLLAKDTIQCSFFYYQIILNIYDPNFAICLIFHRFKSIGQGDYRICFDNTFSRISSKVVFFEVFVEDGKDDTDNKGDDGINFEEDGIGGELNITVEEFLVRIRRYDVLSKMFFAVCGRGYLKKCNFKNKNNK